MYEHNHDHGGQDRPSPRGRRIPREGNVDGGRRPGVGRQPVERQALEAGVSLGRRGGVGAEAASRAACEVDFVRSENDCDNCSSPVRAPPGSRRSFGPALAWPNWYGASSASTTIPTTWGASCTTSASVRRSRSVGPPSGTKRRSSGGARTIGRGLKKGPAAASGPRLSRRIRLPPATAESAHLGADRFAAQADRLATARSLERDRQPESRAATPTDSTALRRAGPERPDPRRDALPAAAASNPSTAVGRGHGSAQRPSLGRSPSCTSAEQLGSTSNGSRPTRLT